MFRLLVGDGSRTYMTTTHYVMIKLEKNDVICRTKN